MPVALYSGPRRRETGAPSLLDSFVDVPRAWLANQLGIDIEPVDLNPVASETLPEGNPFRVLLEVLAALAAGSPVVIDKLDGFAGTIMAEPALCGVMADVLQHAFFGGERSRTHWIRGLTKQPEHWPVRQPRPAQPKAGETFRFRPPKGTRRRHAHPLAKTPRRR